MEEDATLQQDRSPAEDANRRQRRVPADHRLDLDPERAVLEQQLAELTLPLMWSLRQEAVRAFDPLGIRPIRVLLLELIARGMTSPKDLAELLDAVPPAVSNMLSELESKGYLSRNPDPEDGRRIRIALTEAGTEMLAVVQREWLDVSHEKLSVLSADELRLLIGTYRKLLGQGTGS